MVIPGMRFVVWEFNGDPADVVSVCNPVTRNAEVNLRFLGDNAPGTTRSLAVKATSSLGWLHDPP